jgi:PAS domain S-box-containing protein
MFELLFNRSADAILLLDMENPTIVDCNGAAVEMMRCENKKQLLALHPAQLSPECQPDGSSSVGKTSEMIALAVAQGSHRFEWMARRLNGEEFSIEVVLTPIRCAERPLMTAVCRDMTERKRAENALRESQQLLSSVADNLSEAIYRTTPEHDLTFANNAYLAMFGYELDELRRIPRERVYANPSDRAHLLDLLRREGRFTGQEIEFVRKDGTRFWGMISSSAIHHLETGALLYHVGSITDITTRKRMEAELRASEARWRLLFEQSPLSVQIFSPDGTTRRVNAAWKQLFCLTAEDAARFNVLSDPQLEQAGALEKIQRAFAGQVVTVPPLPFRVRPSASDCEPMLKWIGAVMFPLLDEHGRVLEVVCIHEDITKRKQAEDEIRELNATLEQRIAERTTALAASEARMRTLVEHAPEAIVVFDGDTGRFLNCNENAMRLYGLAREHLLKLHPAEVSPLFQPDGRLSLDAAREHIQQALAGEAPVFEWMHKHSSGRLIPCEVRLVRLPAEDRVLVRGSVIDNTERKRRENVQQATYQISEAVHAEDLGSLYHRIHEIVKGLMPAENFYIALFDPASELISFPYFVDERSAKPEPFRPGTGLTGYVLRSGHPLLVDAVMNARKKAIGPAVTFEGFEDISYVESGPAAATWLGVPLSIHGKPIGVMAVQDYHDGKAYGEEEKQILTFVAAQTALAIERKRAEQALRESEEKHRALFQATSQGVIIHDESQFIDVNPAVVRMFGYTRAEDLIGKHPRDFAPPFQPDGRKSAEASADYIKECMQKGAARFEWVSTTGQNSCVPLEVILTRIEMGGRQLIQAVVNDITERKQAETELLKALAREKELGQLKSSFVSMVSHEFRTPLGIIMSSAEILQDYLDQLEADERKHHFHSITKSAKRMRDMMEEVLVLGRLDAGKMDFKPAPLALDTFCQRLVEEVLAATERQCPIELAVDALPALSMADERLLRHIFTNLLTNAVKYSEPGRPVEFLVQRDNQEAVCRIRDRGIGISEHDQKRLFGAFCRGSNVGQRPGTGLGLVIVKRCVELHGGRIVIESRMGEGTTVCVRLPVFLNDEQPNAQAGKE